MLIANKRGTTTTIICGYTCKTGIFDKSNYIVNTGIFYQVFQCATTVILAKMIELWTFYENVVHS